MPPRRTRAAPAPRTAGESATCSVYMWGVAHVSLCESSLCALEVQVEREVFSLVCCLLRNQTAPQNAALLSLCFCRACRVC